MHDEGRVADELHIGACEQPCQRRAAGPCRGSQGAQQYATGGGIQGELQGGQQSPTQFGQVGEQAGKVQLVAVITSYSIHYTKLYDTMKGVLRMSST